MQVQTELRASLIVNKITLGQDKKKSFWSRLGPGLITGAADDDPSGIATYSQVGAGFGYGILWTAFFTFPLMVGIQTVSARIGRVTGQGLAANIRKHYSPWLLYSIVGLLLIANTINIAADIGAMGAALKLLIGGPAHLYYGTVRRDPRTHHPWLARNGEHDNHRARDVLLPGSSDIQL